MPAAKIMVVEGVENVAEEIQKELREMGFPVTAVASSGEQALIIMEADRPDLVLMGMSLDGKLDGPAVASQIRSQYNIPVVYLMESSVVVKLDMVQDKEPHGAIGGSVQRRELRFSVEMALLWSRKKSVDSHLRDTVPKINNMLMGIQGHTAIALMDTHPSHSNYEHFKGIEAFVQQAAVLTKQILEYRNGKKESEKLVKGVETILYIDDDRSLLEVNKRLLEGLGYKVLIAESGNTAINIYRTRGDEIDLIILDMMMPDMGGYKVFEKIKSIRSEVKVLVSSGFGLEGQVNNILISRYTGFIQKPFTLEKLSQKIREVLEKA